jgi:prepilin-type N-terminal cleavage/methylation domain-containing protein
MPSTRIRNRRLMNAVEPRAGFTLVELLVVIAIIGILVALLLPAVQAAREAARRIQCANQLKQFGLAIHSYHDVNKKFPLNHTLLGMPGQGASVSWFVRILPYMEQTAMYDKVDLSLPYAGRSAVGAVWLYQTDLPYIHCPSDPSLRRIAHFAGANVATTTNPAGATVPDDGIVQSSYAGSMGSQNVTSTNAACQPFSIYAEKTVNMAQTANIIDVSGIFARWTAIARISDVTDGLSNTLMMGEIMADCIQPPVRTAGGHANWVWYESVAACATTIVPINERTTCRNSKQISNPVCVPAATANNYNAYRQYAFGFKSMHPGGAQFTLGDGSVRFIGQNIDHRMFQFLGGRTDGNVIGDF